MRKSGLEIRGAVVLKYLYTKNSCFGGGKTVRGIVRNRRIGQREKPDCGGWKTPVSADGG